MGSLVVLRPGAALDLLFLGEQALQLRVHRDDGSFLGRGLLDGGLLGGGLGRRRWGSGLSQVGPPAAATGRDHTAGPGPLAGRLADGHGRLPADLVLAGDLVGKDVALVDPDLDADAAERGAGLAKAVVDVGPQGVQRNPALAIELPPRHLRAAEAAGALDPDALGPGLL